MDRLTRILNSRFLLWLILACPIFWLANAWRASDLFYGEMLHVSGELSARLLIVTLAITPLRLMFPDAVWPSWMLRRRRYFGVASFVYATLHTLIYLDRKQTLDLVIREAADFSMWTGWVALMIFIILAITSNDTSVRRLKRTWKKIHRWVYFAALLSFIHWIFVAFDFMTGLIHFLVLLSLEFYRVWKRKKINSHAN
ncbi:MAG: ferric reductase-like transmembrane domain-containing protein [Proteobacteria bacterium]|nr:ferric reductase-like transmembrane domain-containing protein [Pseudomonadota bacterium]MDA0993251.1 ferric reductase-like transmembrane domain-containing protein [Pseudomonadota bacterium]